LSLNVVAIGLLTVGLPDAADHLRLGDVRPNVGLLLDASCSMGPQDPKINTYCPWFSSNYAGGTSNFTKNQVMRAALVGCVTPGDGIIDRWASRVNFSIWKFGHSGYNTALVTPFDSSQAALESGALSIPNSGNTPMNAAIRDHAMYFNSYFRDDNTSTCRPNFLLMLSDGNPVGNTVNFNFNCPLPGDPRQSLNVASTQPWLGSRYLTQHRDLLCSVTGEQRIRTYTIGFGRAGSFSPSNLQNIAREGLGEYYYASDRAELDASFESIISAMAAGGALFYSAPAIQIDRLLFSDNVAYVAAFKPSRQGAWQGTLKRHCIHPRRLGNGQYDVADVDCLFKAADDGRTMLTNPAALDQWTGSTTTAVSVGGTGSIILSQLGPASGTPRTPYRPRNIVTWRPGTASYVSVQPASWSATDSLTTTGIHEKLLNHLHGYTFDAASNGDPLQVREWPLGDPMHSPTALLRYGDCDVQGKCFVVAAMNDGMLHFFDAANGVETTALVPAELWNLAGAANDHLKKLPNQPAADITHRYFVDGGVLLMHVDQNGDGYIQQSESASLVFGLGRGGAAYYQIPVNRFSGVLSASDNPLRPMPRTAGTAFSELRDTWATPWAGQAIVDGTLRRVLAFPSGHLREADDPYSPTPRLAAGRAELQTGTQQQGCTAIASSSWCQVWNTNGYADSAPQDVTFGPFSVAGAVGYRVRFTNVDIGPNDYLYLRDSQGNLAQTITNNGPGGGVSAWVYDDSFELRWVTNGQKTSDRGWQIGQIEYLYAPVGAAAQHYPTVYLADAERWNGSSPRNFSNTPDGGGLLVRISRSCVGAASGICVSAAQAPDLANMTCPISAELSGYTVNGILKALYWGDECGQIWKAWPTDVAGSAWTARRLVALTRHGTISNQSVSRGYSKDFRKIFRKLDLVTSSCPGQRVVGVYFGTGDQQRPAATDELTNTALTDGRDVVGVIWDSADLPSNLDITNLYDVSAVASVNAKQIFSQGYRGWYWRLGPHERMLRDPLVFEGTTYFKTFTPAGTAAECARTTGDDAVYAVDNCTAEAETDGPGDPIADRRVWSDETYVGGNLLLVTPRDGPPIVSHGHLGRVADAALTNKQASRVPRIFLWREPKRE
jgi:hypothetical protein